jgi:uncharacterized protein (DUF488 family)
LTLPFFTIGHSTRTIEEIVGLLRLAEVGVVADVRTVPKSRTNPQYNKDVLPAALEAVQIGYRHFPELGGLRSRSKEIAPEVNGFWQNASFHNYADHGLSEEFQTALEQLIEMGRARRCAIMCAEAVWWRCHRRIIADHLLARGEQVFHLMGSDRIEPARLTPGAEVQDDETVIYPAAAGERP